MHTEYDVSRVARNEESEDVRWRQWKAKGRKDEARFRRSMKTVAAGIAAIGTVGGTLWLAYSAFMPVN